MYVIIIKIIYCVLILYIYIIIKYLKFKTYLAPEARAPVYNFLWVHLGSPHSWFSLVEFMFLPSILSHVYDVEESTLYLVVIVLPLLVFDFSCAVCLTVCLS